VFVLNYKSCHTPLKHKCPIKESNHKKPTYINANAREIEVLCLVTTVHFFLDPGKCTRSNHIGPSLDSCHKAHDIFLEVPKLADNESLPMNLHAIILVSVSFKVAMNF
jgi:hypothetical protein